MKMSKLNSLFYSNLLRENGHADTFPFGIAVHAKKIALQKENE